MNELQDAIDYLIEHGASVEKTFDIEGLPGLYRIDGGPELTERQVIAVSAQRAERRSYGRLRIDIV